MLLSPRPMSCIAAGLAWNLDSSAAWKRRSATSKNRSLGSVRSRILSTLAWVQTFVPCSLRYSRCNSKDDCRSTDLGVPGLFLRRVAGAGATRAGLDVWKERVRGPLRMEGRKSREVCRRGGRERYMVGVCEIEVGEVK